MQSGMFAATGNPQGTSHAKQVAVSQTAVEERNKKREGIRRKLHAYKCIHILESATPSIHGDHYCIHFLHSRLGISTLVPTMTFSFRSLPNTEEAMKRLSARTPDLAP